MSFGAFCEAIAVLQYRSIIFHAAKGVEASDRYWKTQTGRRDGKGHRGGAQRQNLHSYKAAWALVDGLPHVATTVRDPACPLFCVVHFGMPRGGRTRHDSNGSRPGRPSPQKPKLLERAPERSPSWKAVAVCSRHENHQRRFGLHLSR